MGKLFISHSSKDDGLVRELRQALEGLEQDAWVDSRELRGGDPLWPAIQQALDEASAYAVLVSLDALQSKWVGKELRHALLVQAQRGKDRFPVIPLSLNNTKLGVLEEFFSEEPVYIPLSGEDIDAALDALLAALGKLDPADLAPTPQPKAEPLEELVLRLADLKLYEQDGLRRAQATARLVYEPANPGRREVVSEKSWRFTAPLGPIEADELRWYLEKYAIWPSRHFEERARRVEQNLAEWGRLLHQNALPAGHTHNVLQAWARVDGHANRRFSVYVDSGLVDGAPQADEDAAREAATLLLGLPWELLHDGQGFLFQGARPVRVRRRLPNTRALDVPVAAPPIRILLITARPEDEACGYIDHRASALPLAQAMEALGGLARLHILDPPTLPALREALDRARRAGQPYHVVHFDGHGVYDRRAGLGGLCFEEPQDLDKLEFRRHQTVYTGELGALLSAHRIPLVFLEACQTAQAGQAAESVASELLKVGVASVVAMSHSVLVETARRFVEAFYQALAEGRRVGDAMLAGQRALKDDTFRGRVFGVGELRLEDWFVPVLFQEKDDPQLFRAGPARRTRQAARQNRLGELPKPPETGFVGRSRELLGLQRLLGRQRYVVVRGQGGEGKTALACEFARWMVNSQQIRRAVFVSVETHSTAAAVLDAIGRQLVPGYSVATFDDPDKAIQPVERALAEQATLLVVDNMESLLPPPYLAETTPEALAEDARRELDAILALCARLCGGELIRPAQSGNGANEFAPTGPHGEAVGARILFTSREALPAPFDGLRNRRELGQLDKADAVKLVERALNTAGVQSLLCPNLPNYAEQASRSDAHAKQALHSSADAATEAIERLVAAVHGHARTLALLAPSLRQFGVERTHAELAELMAQMHKRYPSGHPQAREKSVFASVALSLRRLSPEAQDRVRVLGVFHGGVQLDVLQQMMQWEAAAVAALAGELTATGLATANPYNHLSLNPALCPYLLGELDEAERRELVARWVEAMRVYVEHLYQQQRQNTEMAATLTGLELPNLFALLEHTRRVGGVDTTIDLATLLYSLLQWLGKPRLLERLGQMRDMAAAALGQAWNHARFQAQSSRIEQQLASRHLHEALIGAEDLLQRARSAGGQAYPVADYDLAGACWLLGRVLETVGAAELALVLLEEARCGFEAIAQQQANQAAEGMVSVCYADRGNCLLSLCRLEEAIAAYEKAIHHAEQRGDERSVAVGHGQLGIVRLYQRRHPEALEAYQQARERFTRLHEPGSVAISWHQTGTAYQQDGQAEMAEDAYRQSLAIKVRLDDVAGQASTLGQLGILYDDALGRTEEAVSFLRQAAERYAEIGDQAGEGRQWNNLAVSLKKLRRYGEARQAVHQAIACKAPFGHVSEPWKTWDILADIETDVGNPCATAEARAKALKCFLAYRLVGGENHSGSGRLAHDVTLSLMADDNHAVFLLQQLDDAPEAARLRPFIHALQAIAAGSRDRRLADAADLTYDMAAEILLLIETLPAPR